MSFRLVNLASLTFWMNVLIGDDDEIGADVVRAARERYRKTAGAGDAPWQR